jgi:hypothetical protein
MVHDLSVMPCSLQLPMQGSHVEFWDWDGCKRIGMFFSSLLPEGIQLFIDIKTGRCYSPITDITYWKYVE